VVLKKVVDQQHCTPALRYFAEASPLPALSFMYVQLQLLHFPWKIAFVEQESKWGLVDAAIFSH
jgi:hypothetical protein